MIGYFLSVSCIFVAGVVIGEKGSLILAMVLMFMGCLYVSSLCKALENCEAEFKRLSDRANSSTVEDLD